MNAIHQRGVGLQTAASGLRNGGLESASPLGRFAGQGQRGGGLQTAASGLRDGGLESASSLGRFAGQGQRGGGLQTAAARRRAGAALVFAIFAVATIVSLALGAALVARGRVARASSRMGRASLRDAAENALVAALRDLGSDTNSVDFLREKWALDSAAAEEALLSGADGVFVTVSDERARLGVPDCGEEALAALLSISSGLDAAAAAGLAHAALADLANPPGQGHSGASPSSPSSPADASPVSPAGPASPDPPGPPGLPGPSGRLPCEEMLLARDGLSSADRAALADAMPFLSSSAGRGFNVNTAPREVVVASALAGGATPGGAEGLWLRLLMARRRGDVFETTSPTEAMKLLRGEGDVPTAEEIEALQAVQSLILVDSGLFRVEATARRGALSAGVSCVWERGTGRILRWTFR